jgi:uncharacterized protein with HEPN domain
VHSRSRAQRIQDMLAQIAEIELFITEMDYETFSQDARTVRAVLYDLAILGESAASLLPGIEIDYPQIPWVRIRGIRNILMHEYFRVDLPIIWETIQTDLPSLAAELRIIIEQLER